MALPPSIPTSFVPKQPVAAVVKHTSGVNPFLLLSYFILAVAVVGSLAVFGYQFYLTSVAKSKSNDVAVAQNKIDQATVTDFIRLRDRFTAAKGILDNHIEMSQFFDVLETRTLTGVRFSSLRVTVADGGGAEVDLNGTARSFNTLAAESASFAEEKRIKRAIFSGITANPKDSTVSFVLSAELDPSLLMQTASGSAAAAAVAPVAPAQTQTVLPLGSTTPPATTPVSTGSTTTP